MAFLVIGKVKNISEDSLDSFPSPSQIQTMVRKVGLRIKGKTWLGAVKRLFGQKVC